MECDILQSDVVVVVWVNEQVVASWENSAKLRYSSGRLDQVMWIVLELTVETIFVIWAPARDDTISARAKRTFFMNSPA